MAEPQSAEGWVSSQLDRQKRHRQAQAAFDAAVPAASTEPKKFTPARRVCHHGPYIPRPGHCPLCEDIFRDENPTPGQSIDALNASVAAMNKALKELRAAGYSIDVSGGHGGVSYHMSGGPV